MSLLATLYALILFNVQKLFVSHSATKAFTERLDNILTLNRTLNFYMSERVFMLLYKLDPPLLYAVKRNFLSYNHGASRLKQF